MVETPNNSDSTNKPKRHWLDHAAVWAASAAAIAAAAAAGVGVWQVYISNQQLIVSRDSEEKQLRAYVGIAPQGIENFGMVDQVLTAIRKNYGTTPAYDVLVSPTDLHIQMIHDNDPIPNPVAINYPPPNIGAVTMFPSQELPYFVRGSALTAKDNALIAEGNEFWIAYYGIMYYRDAFGNPRHTRFCWRYQGKDMSAAKVDICFGHNDSN